MNMYWEALDFELPSVPGRIWLKAVDTSQPSPLDVADFGQELPQGGNLYRVEGRSIVVLVNRNREHS
jgi:glycogen operon protein